MRVRSEIRQRQIVEVARKIVASKGMEELTIAEIARGVGISEGDIYRHFKSKKEILLLLIDDIERTLLQAVDKAALEKQDPVARLENVLHAHLSYSEQRRGVSFIVIAETLRQSDRELRKRMLQVIEGYLTRLKELLRTGVASGQFREVDLDSASLLFFGMVQATVTMWALGNRSFVLTQKHHPLWEMYRELIAARASKTSRHGKSAIP
jgi:AcrR family transcriptional regulator